VLLLVPLIWLAYLVNLPWRNRTVFLNKLALIPREWRGLAGVPGMVFLHDNFRHLMANTTPLAVLLVLFAYRSGLDVLDVIVVQLLGGFLLWIIGRRARHVGASLMVFGLTGLHIATGLVEGDLVSMFIAFIVAALYGVSFLRSINPLQRGASWEGHLCGFVSGCVVARYL